MKTGAVRTAGRKRMIEDPPPLVAAASVERPSAEEVVQFRGAPTSFVVDALGGVGALDWRIKPVSGGPAHRRCADLRLRTQRQSRSERGGRAERARRCDRRRNGRLHRRGCRRRSPARHRQESRRRRLRHRRHGARPRRSRGARHACLCNGRDAEFPRPARPGHSRPADRLRRARHRLGRRHRRRPRRRRQRAAG